MSTGEFNGSLSFNGSSDYVTIPSAAKTGDFTASLWFKTTSDGVLMSEQDTAVGGGASSYNRFLYVESNGKLHGGYSTAP